MAEENKLQDLIRTSLESIRSMVDANTVVGTPIETPAGTTVIPISKISVGYAGGGLDFNGKNETPKNFGGGGGTGLSVQPVGLLCVHADGSVELIPLGKDGEADPVERIAGLIDKAPDIAAKIKGLFGGKKKKKKKDEDFEAVSDAAVKAADFDKPTED